MATDKEYQALIDSLSGECERLHKENEELRALLPCKGQKMTREEAIKELQESLDTLREYDIAHSSRLKQALEMAIQSLSQEPIECEDAVSRDAVIAWFCNQRCGCGCVDRKSCPILVGIRELPSVTQKSKTGHWIRITNGAMKEKYICSECGRQIENDGIEGLLPIKYPYCHCGAKMVEPQETETWNGIHAQITAPKGTFEKIWEDAESEDKE